MSSYYTLLGVPPDAAQAEIEAAYARQRERYDPERVRDLDAELSAVAGQRTAELERAYRVLSDPERRRQYDASLRGATDSKAAKAAAQRRTISPRERMYAVAGALVALALVAAIWLLTGRDAGTTGTEMGEINRPAPAFSLPDLAGGSVDLESYRGQVVLLNFWATWCEPCKREMPALEAAHQRYGPEGLTIVGVNLTDDEQVRGNTEEDIRAFVEQFNVTYRTALDTSGEVTNDYRVFPLPTSFFIDAEGQIRYVHVGELSLDDVAARFAELRSASAAQP